MISDEKLKIFKYYLEKIETKSIKQFTEFVLLKVPEYFWTLPASMTGTGHGKGETLIKHILGCLYVGEKVAYHQFKTHWTQKQRDQFFSALILHDCWRCGEPGNECRITQDMINEKDLDQGLLGNLKTSHDHAAIGYLQLIKLMVEYNSIAEQNGLEKISQNNFSIIAKSVRYHYGPFLYIKDAEHSLSWPFDSVVQQVHNVDFHNAHNANFYQKKGANEEM